MMLLYLTNIKVPALPLLLVPRLLRIDHADDRRDQTNRIDQYIRRDTREKRALGLPVTDLRYEADKFLLT